MDAQTKAYIDNAIAKAQKTALYSTKNASFHTHNGIDSPILSSSGSSTSINGLATGTSVTSIPTVTQTLLEPTKSFANGITFNLSGSDYGFTVLTAGQYIIVGEIGYTSSQSGYQYQNRIIWTPSGGSPTIISFTYSIGNGGSQTSTPATIIYNLGVGDLIQLYAYISYSGGGTASSTASQTYLAVAKV